MGQVSSHHFLEEEVDWPDYVAREWRSARVRELDQLGGLARPPALLGHSFNCKLEYLGANVLEQASEIRDLFSHKKTVVYGPDSGNANAVYVEKRRIRRKGVVLEVAEWRFRVHAARKRILLVILVCVRLRVGLKKPTRLRRVDTFSYMIPLIFGEDSPKFIEAQLVAISAKDKAANEADAAQQRMARDLLSGADPTPGPNPGPIPGPASAAALGLGAKPLLPHPPLQQHLADSEARTSSGTDAPSSPRYSAGSSASAPKLLMPHEHLSAGPDSGLLSPSAAGMSSPLSKRSSYPGPLSPAPPKGFQEGSSYPGPLTPAPPELRHKASHPAPLSPEHMSPSSPKGNKGLLSPGASSPSSAKKRLFPGQKGPVPPGTKANDSILDGFPSASTSPESLSPTESTASSSKDVTDSAATTATATATATASHAPPKALPPAISVHMDFVSGASSPCARISEDGAAAASISSLDLDRKAPSMGQLPPIKQRPGMLPLPGHRQRHVSESGFVTASGQGGGQQAQARLATRVSEQARISSRSSAQSEAGAGAEGQRTVLPAVAGASPSSRSSSGYGGGGGRGVGVESVLSALEARAAARSARHAAMRERERSARKPLGAQWNSLFRKAPPPANDREARKSAPNLSLPSLPGARAIAKSARPGVSSVRATAAGVLHKPTPPPGLRLLQVSAPSTAHPEQREREQAAEDLLDRARQLDPSWALGDVARRRLLSRSLTVAEQERSEQRSEMMLSMYTNRCNTAWSGQQQWAAPTVTTSPDMLPGAQPSTSSPEHSQIANHIRRGRVAFWFLVGEDSLPTASQKPGSPSASTQDIWTSDPYQLITSCRPGLLHDMHDRLVKGHSFQSRALVSLALAVSDLGGKEALARAVVILSVNDEQEEEVCRSLWDNRFYGFGRENVVIIAQSRRPGYRYDVGARRFIGVQHSAPESTGSGFAAMQLNWCPDAFVLSAEGLVQAVHGTPAEMLAARGVQWMVCQRARDLCVMQGGLDTSFLALGERLLSTQGINMLTQVVLSDNMGTARSLDSIVLRRNGETNSELRMAELSSHALDQAVERAKAQNNNMVAVGIQRYLFHVPSLKKNLVHNLDFRPKLKVRDGLVFLRYEVSDLTSMPGAALGAVQVQKPELLTSSKDLDLLLAAALQQDGDRRLLAALEDLRPKVPVTPQQLVQAVQPKTPSTGGLGDGTTTVVFLDQALSSLPAVRLAVALARPAKDAINLCTFVADAAHIESGRAMLLNVVERLGGTQVQVRIDVVIRDTSSLLDCMCRYLKAWQADLVVVTSRGLTKTEPSAILGSVCLAIVKRMEVPVLIVTPRSAQASNAMYDRRMVRMLLMVEGWTQALLEYAVDRLISPRRGDNLLLGQVCSSRICTKQQAFNMRRYMGEAQRYVDGRAVGRAQAVSLDGPYEQVVEQTVQDYRVNLVGVQLPLGSKALPRSLISLICTSSSAVLVYKKPAGESTGPVQDGDEPDEQENAEDKD